MVFACDCGVDVGVRQVQAALTGRAACHLHPLATLAMVDWANAGAAVALALLVTSPPSLLLSSALLLIHRGRHPITDRSPHVVLALNATLLTSSTLLLLFLSLSSPSSSLCSLPLLSLCLSLLFSPLLLLLRSAVLLFRLELTREVDDFALEEQQRGEEGGPPLPARRKSAAAEDGAEERQPTPISGAAREEQRAKAGPEDGNAEAVQAAAAKELWWVAHRWLIGGPFLCCASLPLFAVAGVGLVGVLLYRPSDSTASTALPSCGLHSAAVLSAHSAGLALFLVHSLLLCVSSHRHPTAYGLRAEAALTSATVLLLLPLSLSLSTLSPLSCWFLLLCFQLLLPVSSTLLPLYYCHTFTLYSSSLAELWSIRSFDDLIRNPLGYDSFLAFLKTEFSEENLSFWGEVEEVRAKATQLQHMDQELREKTEREERDAKAREEEAVVAEERQAMAGAEGKARRPSASSSATTASTSHFASSDPSTTPPLAVSSPRSSKRTPATAEAAGAAWKDSTAGQPLSVQQPQPQLQSKMKPKGGISLGPSTALLASKGRRRNSAGELTSSGPSLSPSPSRSFPHPASQPPSTPNPRASDSLLLPGSTGISPSTPPHHAHQLSVDLSSSSAPPPPSHFLPFPLDDLWSLDALAKLRRVSWSIALDRKAQRHRAESKSHQQVDVIERPCSAAQKPTGVSPGKSPSPRPLVRLPTSGAMGTPTAAAAATVQLSTPTALSGEASPRAAAVSTSASGVLSVGAKAPFMQSIVRALQATKLASSKRVEREEVVMKRLSERRAALQLWLLAKACEVVDRYIAPGSASQVNLPDAIVQRVMERMREVNPVKYANTCKRKRVRGGSYHGMQHTLGLMRHATMHFLATQHHHLHLGKVNPYADRLREKEQQDKLDAHRARVIDEANRVRQLSALSFPISDLFTDAQLAIQQLMEKDSFKRYLSSTAFDHFCATYAQRRTGRGAGTMMGREASQTIAGVLTPRLSGREMEGDDKSRVGVPLMERRSSDSLVRLHGRPSPRLQRSGSFHVVESLRRASVTSVGLSSHVPPPSLVAAAPVALPLSPSAALAPPSPASAAHPLWSDVRKLTLPSAPTRGHSGSILLQTQLARGRGPSSKVGSALPSTSSPAGQPLRTLALVGEVGGVSLSPGSSNDRRGGPSTSVSPRGIREEPEGEIE